MKNEKKHEKLCVSGFVFLANFLHDGFKWNESVFFPLLLILWHYRQTGLENFTGRGDLSTIDPSASHVRLLLF